MARYSTAILISDTPGAHGVFDTVTQTRRTVLCEIRSIGMKEAYSASSQGLAPEIKLVLAHYNEYQGEKLVEYNLALYRVLRTYVSGDSIELTLERNDADE